MLNGVLADDAPDFSRRNGRLHNGLCLCQAPGLVCQFDHRALCVAAANPRQLWQQLLPMALRRIGITLPHRRRRVEEGRGHWRALMAARGGLVQPRQAGSQRRVVATCRGHQLQVHFTEHIAAQGEVALDMRLRRLPGQVARATQIPVREEECTPSAKQRVTADRMRKGACCAA